MLTRKSTNTTPCHPVKQICQIKFYQGKELRFGKSSVRKQSNGVDCGRFAVAFATDLLFRFSPDKRNYYKSKLRGHVLCLEQGKLVIFPQSTERRKISKHSLIIIDIYCRCRTPFLERYTERWQITNARRNSKIKINLGELKMENKPQTFCTYFCYVIYIYIYIYIYI